MAKKPANSEKTEFTVLGLAKRFKIDRETVRKLVSGISDRKEAEAAIKAWQKARSERTAASPDNPETDPETGLTWWKAKLREEVLVKRMDRERAAALAGGELVPIAIIMQALEVVASSWDKFTNDFYCYGNTELNADQREAVQKLAAQAKEDYLAYVKTWQERQGEIRKNGSEA